MRSRIDSRRTVAVGDVALMHCCSATDSSEIATFVKPRSTAIARQTSAKPFSDARDGRAHRSRLKKKMGDMHTFVATHDKTEKATGV